MVAVSSIYPDVDWKLWKFNDIAPSFWTDRQNRRKYFDQVAEHLRILVTFHCLHHAELSKQEDWYKVKLSDITTEGTKDMLKRRYNDSLLLLLQDLYPEHRWEVWRFRETTVPKGFWENRQNQRACLDSIAAQLGMKSMEDWYNVSCTTIIDAGAAALLRIQQDDGTSHALSTRVYRRALSNLLMSVYPEYKWDLSKFHHRVCTAPHRPLRYWEHMDTQRSFMEELGNKLRISSPHCDTFLLDHILLLQVIGTMCPSLNFMLQEA